MLEGVKQGFLGLLLFVGHTFLPEKDEAGLTVRAVKPVSEQAVEVVVRLDMVLNRQMEQLVDAGVPLRFKISAFHSGGDTSSFFRTLKFNLADYKYTYSDSADGLVSVSRPYPMIHLALLDFCEWEFQASLQAAWYVFEAEILPSRVSRLNRTVEMSRLWGQSKVNVLNSI